MKNYAIEMIGITKKFPGVLANDNINFSVKQNEVHALLGENGAGKSTLMSILFGAYDLDQGIIKVNGNKIQIKDPNIATYLGIGMVHQHFKLVKNYTVTENIILGIETVNKFGLLDLSIAEKRVEKLSKQYGLQVNPKAKIEDISVGMQQRVEILKTLYRNANILILDEPSAVLTPQEIDELMDIILRLKNEGKTIILITHKLKEIKTVADRCTVLRRGKAIGTVDVNSVSEEKLAEMMVGRTVRFNLEKKEQNLGNIVLDVKSIFVKNNRGSMAVKNFSLNVKEGEIVGLAGVDGNGQSELIYALTGMLPIESGNIYLNNLDITKLNVKTRVKYGMAHVPEDRQKHGLVLDFSIKENLCLKNYDENPYVESGILNFNEMKKNADLLIKEYDIRAGEGAFMQAKKMSGGNQQKVILAREISMNPKLLIIAQPTRGLDVGAIEYIHKKIIEQRDSGKAVLLISLELDEIMNLCDRIAVISKGENAGVFNFDEINEQQIGFLMAGEKIDKEAIK